jgi:hypothetical protein
MQYSFRSVPHVIGGTEAKSDAIRVLDTSIAPFQRRRTLPFIHPSEAYAFRPSHPWAERL